MTKGWAYFICTILWLGTFYVLFMTGLSRSTGEALWIVAVLVLCLVSDGIWRRAKEHELAQKAAKEDRLRELIREEMNRDIDAI